MPSHYKTKTNYFITMFVKNFLYVLSLESWGNSFATHWLLPRYQYHYDHFLVASDPPYLNIATSSNDIKLSYWDELVDFAAQTKLQLVFDLNCLNLRSADNTWNTSNAELLFRHMVENNQTIYGFQLGEFLLCFLAVVFYFLNFKKSFFNPISKNNKTEHECKFFY